MRLVPAHDFDCFAEILFQQFFRTEGPRAILFQNAELVRIRQSSQADGFRLEIIRDIAKGNLRGAVRQLDRADFPHERRTVIVDHKIYSLAVLSCAFKDRLSRENCGTGGDKNQKQKNDSGSHALDCTENEIQKPQASSAGKFGAEISGGFEKGSAAPRFGTLRSALIPIVLSLA